MQRNEAADSVKRDPRQVLVDRLDAIVTDECFALLREVSLIPPVEPPSDWLTEDPAAAIFALGREGADAYLGIPLWTVPLLLSRLTATFHATRQRPLTTPADLADAWRVTRLLLLVCPEYPMALNLRKRLLSITRPAIDAELAASRVFLSRQPGSSVQWHHRLWLVEREVELGHVDGSAVLEREHAVIAAMAARKPRNYYAWTFRANLRCLLRPADAQAWDARDRELVTAFLADGHGADRTAQHYLRICE
ncbi:hypothetical protein H9P43_004940 [Blastocladiella emersonii ATCC 22665]|nr:hypothetical protein H9P43_004940 [Blastocladiella emersonii ATCC 22665]